MSKENIQSLMEMGFTQEQASRALKKADNDVNAAALILFGEGGDSPSPNFIGQSSKWDAGSPSASSTSMQDDDDLRRAIEMSKGEQNPGKNKASGDDDLKRAIELSKKEAEQAKPPKKMSASEECQADLDRAIMESLKDTNFQNMKDGEQPGKRKPDTPVGLLNSGNWCYMNSFIQTYFMLPKLRNEVLGFKFEAIDKELEKDLDKSLTEENKHRISVAKKTVRFLKELQNLFALMQQSNRSSVNTRPLLHAFHSALPQYATPGVQQDVGEINMAFLGLLQKGFLLYDCFKKRGASAFLLSQEELEKVDHDLIKKLFFGTIAELLTSKPEAEHKLDRKQETSFQHLIVPVMENLEQALTDSLHSDVTLKVKGVDQTVDQTRWIVDAPQVLFLQENRVRISTTTMLQFKDNSPMFFTPEIYLDRYMLQNREKASIINNKVLELTRQNKSLIEEQEVFESTAVDSVRILPALEAVQSFCAKNMKDDGSVSPELRSREHADRLVKYLNELQKNVKKHVDAIGEKQRAIRDEIQKLVDDESLKKLKYVLYSVWIHGGSPESGHYFVYVRNLVDNRWYEMNDVQIRESSLDMAINHGLGSRDASQSASFLVYVSEGFAAANSSTAKMELSESLRKYVEMVDKDPSITDRSTPELTEEQRKFLFSASVTRANVVDYLLRVKDNCNIPFLGKFCNNVASRLTALPNWTVFVDNRLYLWSSFLCSMPSEQFEKLYVSWALQHEFDRLMKDEREPKGLPREYLGPAFESVNSLMKKDKTVEKGAQAVFRQFANIGRVIILFLVSVYEKRHLQHIASMVNLLLCGNTRGVVNGFFRDHMCLMVDLLLILASEKPDEVTPVFADIIANWVEPKKHPLGQAVIKSLGKHSRTKAAASLLEKAQPGSLMVFSGEIPHYNDFGLEKADWGVYTDYWFIDYCSRRSLIRDWMKYSDSLKNYANTFEREYQARESETRRATATLDFSHLLF